MFNTLFEKYIIRVQLGAETLIDVGEEIFLSNYFKKIKLINGIAVEKLLYKLKREIELTSLISEISKENKKHKLLAQLLSIADNGFLDWFIYDDNKLLLTVRANGEFFSLSRAPSFNQAFQFSEGVFLQAKQGFYVIESYSINTTIEIWIPELVYFFSKINFKQEGRHLSHTNETSHSLTVLFLAILYNLGFVKERDEHCDRHGNQLFHQMLFYKRFAWSGNQHLKFSASALSPLSLIHLPRPTPKTGEFWRLLEQRVSTRVYSQKSLDLSLLAEFLQRTFGPTIRDSSDIPFRSYPSSGAIYEMDIAFISYNVDNVERGLYKYDLHENLLIKIADYDRNIKSIFENSINASSISPQNAPAVLLLFESNLGLLLPKYGNKALALTLENLGVIYQTMYLISTALSLSGCISTFIVPSEISNSNLKLMIGGYFLGVANIPHV